MEDEVDEAVSISGLQHLVYCERQAALIHVERIWEEDGATAAGRVVHDRVHEFGGAHRPDVRTATSVSLHSSRLGLRGQADLVEYRRDPEVTGGWRPYPVEFKRGRQKKARADRVQLCAQAICLEEAHGVEVPEGALYYATSHRRVVVPLDPALRADVERVARRLHEVVRGGLLPRADPGPKCRACSLRPACLPRASGPGGRATDFLRRLVAAEEDS